MNKLPEITIFFWAMKICATTLGETAGDLFSMTMNLGYAVSSLLLLCIFLISLVAQLRIRYHQPWLYWSVILLTSTAGTTVSDFMDRTLGLGYGVGALLLASLLAGLLVFWKITQHNISVSNVSGTKPEILYWLVILVSNTLGTALGDYLSDSSGLGFFGGAMLISSVITITAIAYWYTTVSRVALFWIAFVLTRPLGATIGDLMTKPIEHGGLNWGTQGSSFALFIILVSIILYTSRTAKPLATHN
ncbi:hypothetical protein [Cellvibrio sp. UBA7671]|uniref:COG4705 family protein n=1 Tax=Cellvibrio sp. UBA7671 TaxID=1946312 RepID=UPI002F34F11A